MDEPGTEDETVRAAYARCRRLQRRHDPTFFLATARLPRERRPAVHALYGFLRGADEIVDGRLRPGGTTARHAALDGWHAALTDALAGRQPAHPVVAALADAGRRHDLPLHLLDRYMTSMGVDCEDQVRITDTAALDRYMDGSAATVGRMMAPLLDAAPDAAEPLAQLGVAFQLTNFIRDVREDWAMNRIYLPGLDEESLRLQIVTDAFRTQIAAHVVRARRLFLDAGVVTAELAPAVRPGIRLACGVYEGVLDRVERLDGDVLTHRTGARPRGLLRAAVGSVRPSGRRTVA